MFPEPLISLVHPEGIEPPTFGFVVLARMQRETTQPYKCLRQRDGMVVAVGARWALSAPVIAQIRHSTADWARPVRFRAPRP
jgi:hypothetical protein